MSYFGTKEQDHHAVSKMLFPRSILGLRLCGVAAKYIFSAPPLYSCRVRKTSYTWLRHRNFDEEEMESLSEVAATTSAPSICAEEV